MLTLKEITALEQFRLQTESKSEIIEESIKPHHVCFSVQKGVAVSATYNSMWAREARGIVFNTATGEVVSRPLAKFFNVNEREETLVNKLEWSKVTRIMQKRDGSMIHTCFDSSSSPLFYLKSKKKHDSDVAIAATKWIELEKNKSVKDFCSFVVGINCTAIFEFTSPEARIVVEYANSELQLLHIRHNVTGRYFSYNELKNIADEFGVNVVEQIDGFTSFNEMLTLAESKEGVEGWVIQFENGEMVKIKTSWYMKLHRAMTFYRERDIAALILDEQIDDIKALLVGDNIDISAILEIENKFSEDMGQLINDVNEIVEFHKEKSPKEMAQMFKGVPIFGLIMSKVNGKIPNYERHFRIHKLKQNYSLISLGHLTPKTNINAIL